MKKLPNTLFNTLQLLPWLLFLIFFWIWWESVTSKGKTNTCNNGTCFVMVELQLTALASPLSISIITPIKKISTYIINMHERIKNPIW